MNASSDASLLLASLPALPRDDSGPVFAQPWQAQAFALVLHLHASGAFTWQQWTQTLARELKVHEPDAGDRYYERWLSALERLVIELGLADLDALTARKHAWADAYRRSPHGTPVIEEGDAIRPPAPHF